MTTIEIGTSEVTIEDTPGMARLVSMKRDKYDKRFQLQSTNEAYALYLAIAKAYGFQS